MSPATRRAILGRAGAILAVGAIAAPAALAAAPHPDAELLAAIARFDALEHGIERLLIAGCESLEAEEAADEAVKPLRDEQDELLRIICGLPTRTSDGLRARAASLVLWDIPTRDRVAAPDNPDDYWNDRMMAAILRGVLAGQGAA
jgi:hypothetical protein